MELKFKFSITKTTESLIRLISRDSIEKMKFSVEKFSVEKFSVEKFLGNSKYNSISASITYDYERID